MVVSKKPVKKKRLDPNTRRRYSVLIPQTDYKALQLRAQAEESTVSALICNMLEARFAKRSRAPIPLGTLSGAECVKASVFLAPAIYDAAVYESERQHGKQVESEPLVRGRRASAFARVLVGMIAEMVTR